MTKDFLETVIEEQKILDIGLKQSKQNKKERLDKEKKKTNKPEHFQNITRLRHY